MSYGFVEFLNLNHGELYGTFAFLATFGVYNGQRLFKVSSHAITPWLSWVLRNKKTITILVIISLFGAFGVIIGIVNWNFNVLSLLMICVLISTFYVIRFGKRNLREIPFIKIHLIAASWTSLLIIFPMLNEGESNHLFEIGMAHYAYVLAVTIPFDIRDLKYDLKGQGTIPQLIGVSASKMLAIALLLSSMFILSSLFPILFMQPMFYLAFVLQMGLIVLMSESRSDLYCAGWIDGSIAIFGLAYLFA